LYFLRKVKSTEKKREGAGKRGAGGRGKNELFKIELCF
jgi:hypothetical protein